MAFSHHNTTQRHDRRRSETKFLRAKHRPDHNITTGLKLSIDLDTDPVTKFVHDKHLLGLRQTDLPGGSRIFNG